MKLSLTGLDVLYTMYTSLPLMLDLMCTLVSPSANFLISASAGSLPRYLATLSASNRHDEPHITTAFSSSGTFALLRAYGSSYFPWASAGELKPLFKLAAEADTPPTISAH